MNYSHVLFCFQLGFIVAYAGILGDVVKKLHKGADDVTKGIFDGIVEVSGTPVDTKEVTFFLHTSKDEKYADHQIDPFQPIEIAQTKGKIYFLVHGWSQNRTNTPWLKPFTELILRRYADAHVIQVDWHKPASDNYPSAAFATESVGEVIANVIQKVVKEHGTPLKNIILIGHSLGGQVVGWVGKKFAASNEVKLPRILALDPAGPLFNVRPIDRRLNKLDADVVIVVHTDEGVFGFSGVCGTIDFFPNGGYAQPGCLKTTLSNVSSLTDPIWCSHRRAYSIFVEAVKNEGLFIAQECKDYEEFKAGKCEDDNHIPLGDIETMKTGKFYLETSGKPPFIKK